MNVPLPPVLLAFPVLVAALACTLGQAPAQASSRKDFELAQEALARGEILPLARILEEVQKTQPGQVIEVEFDISDGLMIYEVELVTPDGRLMEIELNARTGEILDVDTEDDD